VQEVRGGDREASMRRRLEVRGLGEGRRWGLFSRWTHCPFRDQWTKDEGEGGTARV